MEKNIFVFDYECNAKSNMKMLRYLKRNAIGIKNASVLFNELFISPRNVLKKSTVTHLQFSNIWFLEKCTMLNDIIESHIYYL